jgi:hypothetical protein
MLTRVRLCSQARERIGVVGPELRLDDDEI